MKKLTKKQEDLLSKMRSGYGLYRYYGGRSYGSYVPGCQIEGYDPNGKYFQSSASPHVVNSLEDRGLIARSKEGDPGRWVRFVLTEDGQLMKLTRMLPNGVGIYT